MLPGPYNAPNADPVTKGDGAAVDVMVIGPCHLRRQELTHVLTGTAYRVAMECEEVTEALAIVRKDTRPHLVILDVHQPPEADADAIRALRQMLGETPIVLLVDELSSPRTTQLLEAGVDAFLPKELNPGALERYVNPVMIGEKVIPARLVTRFLVTRGHQEDGQLRPAPNSLSSREA